MKQSETILIKNKGLCRVGVSRYFCSMNRIIAIYTMMCCCLAARAQKMPVVADMDTRVPIAGVVVSTNNGQRVVTDYTGHFHTQLPFSSATVSKKHYMQRRVNATELQQDTLFLIPQEVVLNDVVVTAPGMSFDMKKAMQKEMEVARLPKPSEGFNLLGLFQLIMPSAKAKAQSRAGKIKKILDKY